MIRGHARVTAAAVVFAIGCAGQRGPETVTVSAAPLAVSLATMPYIVDVDERFESYNVEMAEVIGAPLWKPYGHGKVTRRGPIDLASPRLRKLAAALGPAYVRVSGTSANTVYFQDTDDPVPGPPPEGFQGVLTRREWAGVVSFSRAVDAKLVTSFAISEGVRDAAGVWTPEQARRLLAYTNEVGGEIAAAEFFDEPTFAAMGGAPPGYDAAAYARDFAVFLPFARATAPNMLIVGPGSAGEALPLLPGPLLETTSLLAASPRPRFDVFSYHFYGAASVRCSSTMPGAASTTPDEALSAAWLSRTDRVNAFYSGLRDRYEPGKPMWVTETADAACGGNPWAPSFLDTFRYVDQLARLARRGVAAIFHNTLASSDSGLIDQRTLTPRPKYWAALLWRKLMGRTVLDAGPSRAGLRVYAHCLRGRPRGVVLVAINTSRTTAQSIELPLPADRYMLAAKKLDDTRVELNGAPLQLGADDALPELRATRTPPGQVDLAPASITFLAVADAQNETCS